MVYIISEKIEFKETHFSRRNVSQIFKQGPKTLETNAPVREFITRSEQKQHEKIFNNKISTLRKYFWAKKIGNKNVKIVTQSQFLKIECNLVYH
jgi:hypothetical protein